MKKNARISKIDIFVVDQGSLCDSIIRSTWCKIAGTSHICCASLQSTVWHREIVRLYSIVSLHFIFVWTNVIKEHVGIYKLYNNEDMETLIKEIA